MTQLRVAIVGGGFAGLMVARHLRRPDIQVELIDRRNFHLFQPLLYQVATGALSPANIAAPLRAIVARQPNVHVRMDEVVDFDVTAGRVRCLGGTVNYDLLVVSAGATHSYFGHDEWERFAPGLKTLEDATDIRRRFLIAFEQAELEQDSDRQRQLLTFVVVGGGPTGVEMAGAMAEIARNTLRRDFRRINPAQTRVVLVEAADRVLGAFEPGLAAKGQASLSRIGVEVRVNAKVTAINEGAVDIETAAGPERIHAATVVWAAGVRGNELAMKLAAAANAQLDRVNRLIVEPDLTLPGHPEIFAIGDIANFTHQTGKPLPGVAPVAMQQGKYVAKAIIARAKQGSAANLKTQTKPFRYRDRGSMATIGRAAAIADFGWIRLAGVLAWLGWLFVHLLFLVQFSNRLLVLMQWAWSYLTWNRSARLITVPSKPLAAAADLPPITRPRAS